MKKLTRFVISLSLLGILLVSCSSPQKMLDGGQYDTVIYKARKKLIGQKLKSPKYVKLLEDAFRKANERDIARVQKLERSGTAHDWDEIFSIGRNIENRQAMVNPLLPLVDKKGHKAEFRIVKTEDILWKAKDNAVIAWYDLAQDYLQKGREGDFMSAREAMHALENIEEYYSNYRDVRELMELARELGTVRVLIRLENAVSDFISPALEREILDINLNSLDEYWVDFVNNRNLENIQFEAILKIDRISLSPETLDERQIKRKKEIKDGWQYVLDANGNVMKDSLGNDIKVDRHIDVQATILETHQDKRAAIEGGLELKDLRSDRVIAREPLFVEATFHHKAQRFFGDERALSNSERKQVGPVPFPSDEEMILLAVDQLKPVFLKKLERSRWL